MKTIMLIFSTFFFLSSCQETKKVYIADHLIDCQGVAPQKCMLYKENSSDEWSYFYDQIDGFKYEEGFSYQLEVLVKKVDKPLADASAIQYTLVKVLSKEKQNNTIAQHTPNKISKPQENIITVEYQAASRGSFLNIKIDKKLIQKTKDRNLQNISSKQCSKEDWNTIVGLLKDVSIKTISELEAPTEKRLFDGAPHSILKITSDKNTFTSNSFDHGHPPSEIKQLVKTILSLSESIE